MRKQVFLLFVLTLLRSVVGSIPKNLNTFLNAEPTSMVSGIDSVEGHPNLQLLPDGCGAIIEDRILTRISVGLDQYPWIVLIAYKTRSGLNFQCGGSLINDRYVLTAVHCISNQMLAGVRVGEFDVTTATDCQGESPSKIKCETHQDLRIEEAIIHPDYIDKSRPNSDIGLLRLKKPVNFTYENAGTICLPVTKELQHRKLAGLSATVAGWGYSETGSVVTKLQDVEVPIRTQDNCSQVYNISRAPGGSNELDNKLCAGETGRDTCIGDFGGPLMVKGVYKNLGLRFIQHGLLSYGRTVCGTDVPSVYTDVSKYVKWILDNMKP